MHRTHGLLFICLFAFLPGCLRQPVAIADQPAKGAKSDLPMYGGSPARNMVNTIDKDTPVVWNVEDGKRKNIKWVAEIGGKSYGGPVIANGVVYMGTDNRNPRDKKIVGREKAVLMAFNEADGKFLWQIVHDLPNVPSEEGRSEGLCSTPIVEGKRLYYVTPQCELICATTEGKTEWSYDMMKELKVVPYHLSNSSPLIVGDLVMVVTGNGRDDQGNLASPKAPSFIAVNKNTGKLAWQSNLPGDRIVQGQFTSPVLATVDGKEQVIFAGGDAVIYGFEPKSGDLIWKCDCNPTRKPKEFSNYFVSSPVVLADRLYIGMGVTPEGATTKFSYFVCLDVTKKGDVSFKNYDAKSPANKNSALVWAFGGVINPPPAKGRKVNFGSTISTAAVHDGLIYIPEESGYLHCLDAKTGERYWEHDFKAAVWGSAFCVDNKVYVATEDSSVVIFEHGKKCRYYIEGKAVDASRENEKKLPSASIEDSTHSTPVVANGVLYIATRSKLYAIANGK